MKKAEEEKHVGIGKKLYNDIEEYCVLNGIQVKEYVNILLNRAFMEDKYGKRPFKAQKNPQTGNVTVHNVSDAVVNAKVVEILNDPEQFKGVMDEMKSGDEKYAEFVNNVGQEEYKKVVDECIYGTDETETAKKEKDLSAKGEKDTNTVVKPIKRRTIK